MVVVILIVVCETMKGGFFEFKRRIFLGEATEILIKYTLSSSSQFLLLSKSTITTKIQQNHLIRNINAVENLIHVTSS